MVTGGRPVRSNLCDRSAAGLRDAARRRRRGDRARGRARAAARRAREAEGRDRQAQERPADGRAAETGRRQRRVQMRCLLRQRLSTAGAAAACRLAVSDGDELEHLRHGGAKRRWRVAEALCGSRPVRCTKGWADVGVRAVASEPRVGVAPARHERRRWRCERGLRALAAGARVSARHLLGRARPAPRRPLSGSEREAHRRRHRRGAERPPARPESGLCRELRGARPPPP